MFSNRFGWGVAKAGFALALGTALLRAQTPDPQMAAVLAQLQAIQGIPNYSLAPQDARQQFSTQDAAKIIARQSGKQLAPDPVGSIMDQMTIPGPGGAIPIRVYTPAGTGPFPVVVYFHGGGFVIATIDTYDASSRALANMAGTVVISVEYRKAPEHPFPAALDDAIAAYQWAVRNTNLINGIPGKIAVAGESAGGNLATEICLNMRDQGGPMPVFQLLIYPITNNNLGTESDFQFQNAQPLNLPSLQYFAKYTYLNPADQSNPNAFPLKATLTGLPPATIIAAQIDPLFDDGQEYSAALQSAKVPVQYRLYPGVTHEFFGLGAVVDTAKQAEMDAANDLKAAFGQ